MRTITIHLTRRHVTAGVAILAAALFLATGASSCGSGNASGQSLENSTSRQDLSTFEQVQPAPHFPYSVYRQDAIKIEAAQALGEATTTFFFEPGNIDPIDSCPSIGDPIPNTAELTNPVQGSNYTDGNGNYNTIPVGNIDPNGLYAPANSSGTNVVCVLANGQQQLRYWEGFVYAINGQATWDRATQSIVTQGGATMPTCVVAKVKGRNAEVCTK